MTFGVRIADVREKIEHAVQIAGAEMVELQGAGEGRASWRRRRWPARCVLPTG
jgi:hypothetical protein